MPVSKSKKTNDEPPKIHGGVVTVASDAHGIYLVIDLGNPVGVTLTPADAEALATQIMNARHDFLNDPENAAA